MEISIKHGKCNAFSVRIESLEETVLDLKRRIFEMTGIEPSNQKMPNLKVGMKLAPNEAKIGNCKIPKHVMLLGKTSEEKKSLMEKEKVMMENAPEIFDDFEEDVEEALNCDQNPIYVARLRSRIEKCAGMPPLNPTRQDKHLLVLDIDYTLFDHKTPGETPGELARPFLHEFLESAYRRYDIVIWSATSMLWIQTKMKELGMLSHPRYKILALVDSKSMITVQTKQRGIFNCKPLGWIWAQAWSKERGYDASNTIMFDDLRRNFAMNPSSGLKIRPFRNAHTNRMDNELQKLSMYIDLIARKKVAFRTLEHKKWEKYCLKALKDGELSKLEAKEAKRFWPNSSVVRELAMSEQQNSHRAQTEDAEENKHTKNEQ